MDGNFSRSEPNSTSGPIDHAHLGRYTLGNRDLEIEVLHLFAGQAPSTLDGLRTATCERSWHMAAHTLKGSARAVGAWTIATTAEDAERAGFASPDREAYLTRLEEVIAEAAAYIGLLA